MKQPTKMKRIFQRMSQMGNWRISKEELAIKKDLNPDNKDDIALATYIHNARVDNSNEEVR